MNQYQNSYSQPAYAPAQNTAPADSGELLDGAVISAEQLGDYDNSYVLLPEGDYKFTVVDISSSRYQPGPKAKIGLRRWGDGTTWAKGDLPYSFK